MHINGHPKVIRAMRILPMVGAALWLLSFVLIYGPLGSSTHAVSRLPEIAFALFVSSLGVAFASGVYEPKRHASDLASRITERIDWDEFDRLRARWHDGELV